MLTLVGEIDPIGAGVAQRLLSDGVCNAIWYGAETGSTSSLALSEIQSGNLDDDRVPKLYFADAQTSGRGRHGRNWLSGPGCLTFSLVIRWPFGNDRSSRLLSLAVGCAVARTLEYEFAPTRTQLKWPNDVYLAGGKVAGILLESSPTSTARVVIGVGLNVNEAPDLSNEAAAGPAQSIVSATGRNVHRYQLLPLLVASVRGFIEQVRDDPDELVREFRSRCLLTGKMVEFQDSAGSHRGHCLGIAEDGSLLVETGAGTHRLQSGEARLVRVRVRP